MDDALREVERQLEDDPAQAMELADALIQSGRSAAEVVAAARLAATAARHLHDPERSTAYFQLALDHCDPEGYDAARIGISMAGNAAVSGQFGEANELLDRVEASDLLGSDGYLVAVQRASILTIQGRHLDAVDEFDRLLTAFDLDPSLTAHTWVNRGSCLIQLGRLERGREDLDKAFAWYRSKGDRRGQLDAISNLVLCEAMAGDTSLALTRSEQARKLAEGLGIADGLTQLDVAKAFLAAGLGQEAERAIRAAIEALEFNGNVGWIGEAYTTKAMICILIGAGADAIRAAKRAEAESLGQGNELRALKARRLLLLASVVHEPLTVDLDEGLAIVGRLKKNRIDVDAQELSTKLAISAWRRGRHEHCGEFVRLAQSVAGELPLSIVNRGVAAAVGALSEGSPQRALEAVDEAVRVVEEHRMSLAATELRARAAGVTYDVNLVAMAAAFAHSDPLLLWQWSERLRAVALDLGPGRMRTGEVADAMTELRLASLNARSTGRQDALVEAQANVQQLLRTEAARAADHRRPLDAPLAASVTFIEHDGYLHRIDCDDRGDLSLQTNVADLAQLDRLAKTVRSDWRRWLRHRAGADRSDASRIALDQSIGDLDRIVGLSPTGPELSIIVSETLHQVPWMALPSLAGVSMAVGPSAAAVAGRTARRGYVEPEIVLAAGPGLAHVETEMADLAAIWPRARVFPAGSTSVDELISNVSGSRIVHLAAHGTFRADASMFSSLEFDDGPMTVVDLESVEIAPEIAVLSACDAGTSSVLPGNETLGMVSALLGIGCRSVIAPVLPVADEDCHVVMGEIHRGLANGLAPSQALEAAARRFPTGSPERRLAASFVCFGSG